MKKRRRLSGDVAPDHVFHFHGHGAIHNISEMIDTLRKVSTTTFRHHVDDSHNHIADWIQHIYKDKHVADHLRKTTDKDETIQLLEEALDVGQQEEQKYVQELTGTQETESLEPVHQRLDKVNKHIDELEDNIKHMLDYSSHTRSQIHHTKGQLFHHDLRRGILEFSFGLIIGIIIGIAVAKTAGFY